MLTMAALAKLLLPLALAYVAVAAVMWLMQDRLIFRGDVAQAYPASASELKAHALTRRPLPDGVFYHRQGRPEAPVLIGFGGNAQDAGALAVYLAPLFPTWNLYVLDYYSDDARGQDVLTRRAAALYDVARAEHPTAAVGVVGISLGTGVAAQLAARRPIAGAALVMPFDALWKVARANYPWLPVKWLLRHPFDSAAVWAASDVPLAAISAAHDTLVTPDRTVDLLRVAKNLRVHEQTPGADHSSLLADPRLDAFLKTHLPALMGVPR
jgi:pimeloyl-ACP methyl ester carboxylesterase